LALPVVAVARAIIDFSCIHEALAELATRGWQRSRRAAYSGLQTEEKIVLRSSR
jgi:hypothetical protein